MKVAVDQDKCCGAGTCVMLVPDVFDQRDEDGVVVLLDEQPPEQLHESVREAVDMCPTGAIEVADSE